MTAPAIQIEPFYMDSPRDCLFYIFTAPSKQLLKGPVLDLRPFFTEEINNSRRMAALQALYDDQTNTHLKRLPLLLAWEPTEAGAARSHHKNDHLANQLNEEC